VNFIKNAPWLAVILFTLAKADAASFYVDDASQFNAKVDKFGASFTTLSAGDRVFLKGGNWAGLITTLTGSMSDALAQSNPAIIQACDSNYNPTIGGVTVTGLSQIQLAGSGIVFSGVTFGPTSGMFKKGNFTDYGGNDSTAYIIQFSGLSRHMTVSHLKFDYCGRDNTDYANNDHYGAWLHLNGYHHTVQYCEFQGRDFNPADIDNPNPATRTSIRQATVMIYKDNADTVDWGYHNLRYNYFGERKIPLGDDARLYIAADGSLPADLSNGWETIRVGNSSFVEVDFNTTVEYNVFYHSIQAVDGGPNDQSAEPEMISNKSRRNTYRYNTILNNYGHLCLRQGDYCVVQGNTFLAGGAYNSSGNIVLTEERNDRMGGVRAFGFGHTIANNYFYKISGEGIRSALCLGSGITDPGTLASQLNGNGAAGYETANYTQVLNNTFIDCHAITLDNPNGQLYPVYGTQFHNNLVHFGSNIGAAGIIGNTDALTNHGGLASGNWVYSSNSSQRSSASTMLGTANNTISGSAANDPKMTDFYDVLTVPTAASPVLGRAAALPQINDTSPTARNYDLAGNVSGTAGLDMRALSRPASARDVGNYEREATGNGVRPLRRFEVGLVPAAYPTGPVLAEAFPSNTRTTQNPPNSAKWFCSGTGSNVSVSGGTMAVNTTGARHMVAHFPAVSLAVGDSLNLSFNFSVTAPADILKGLRAGLLYSGASPKFTADNQNPTVDYAGYGSLINPVPTVAGPATLQKRGGSATLITSVGTAWTSIASGAPTQSLVPGTIYQGVLAIRRTAADQAVLTTTYSGGVLSNYTVAGTDVSGIYNTFDTVALAVGTTAGIPAATAVRYSNILISKVTPLLALPGSANGAINQLIDLNLQPLVSNAGSPFKPLTFSIVSATNGTAIILADGKTARFTPRSDFAGNAGFSYSVSDGTVSTSASIRLSYSVVVTAFTSPGPSTWTCPADVNSIQIECWGGGGAGGSARRGNNGVATGGGGAGGAYAKLGPYSVVPGATYFLSVGNGGVSAIADGASVAGGDSWFNSVDSPSSIIRAKGGAGGVSGVTVIADKYGAGGSGTATGSVGDVINAGGSGSTSTLSGYGGGGGGSGGTGSTGINATANSGAGGDAVSGGGNGGNPNPISGSSADGQTPTTAPGGGGGGARAASATQRMGGAGAAGKIVLTLFVGTSPTVPDPPTGVTATAGNALATVSFTPPASNGGSAITGYSVTSSPGGFTGTGASSPITVSGLSNGTAYSFTVTATNAIGTGSISGASSSITPATVPTVTTPSSASITAIAATLGGNVTSDGGAAVGEIGVVYSPAAANDNPRIGGTGVTTLSGTGTTGVFTVSVDILTPGNAYSFAAYAINSMGTAYSPVGSFTTLSDDATLSSLSLSAGNLTPSFSGGTHSYAFSASHDLTSTTVSPASTQANATITVNGSSVLSGNTSTAIPLNVGSNSITAVVTAQDGSTAKTYTVTVTRQSAIASWRNFHFNTTENSGAAADAEDPDGDGLVNAQEYVFGTVPTTPDGGGLVLIGVAGANVKIEFTAVRASGTGYTGLTRHYTVETTTDLTNPASWTPVTDYSNIVGTNQSVTITSPIGAIKCFYRLKAWLQ
jgi:hypothetical protein